MNCSVSLSVDGALVKRNRDALLLATLSSSSRYLQKDFRLVGSKSQVHVLRHSDAHGYSSPFDNDESVRNIGPSSFCLLFNLSWPPQTELPRGSISKCGRHVVRMFSTTPIVITMRHSSSTRKRFQPRIPRSSLLASNLRDQTASSDRLVDALHSLRGTPSIGVAQYTPPKFRANVVTLLRRC